MTANDRYNESHVKVVFLPLSQVSNERFIGYLTLVTMAPVPFLIELCQFANYQIIQDY